ncbi:MAG: hypothetical protein LBL45_04850 [Treponema sp.]|jgi:hypothetical protein|nr:hypothetical protein [Treponema sp.]
MMRFKKLFMLRSVLFFTAGAAALWAQSFEDVPSSLQDKALVLDITARVMEKDSQEVWNSSSSKITISGRAVGVKLLGANVLVAVQFTPYLARDGNTILVIQGQIWVNIPDQGVQYQTTLQTIPVTFGEQVRFFPLGASSSNEDAYIEVLVNVSPYKAPDGAVVQEPLKPEEK